MNRIGRVTLAITLLGSMAALGCGGEPPEAPPTLDIVAEDYEFTAPDSVPAGWTTVRMNNQGSEHHVVLLYRLPDDKTYGEFKREIVPPLDSVWSMVVDGTIEESEALKRVLPLLPDWYPAELVFSGGVSLLAPGRTGETTVRLEPGLYVLECYVMTPEKQLHLLEGMARPLHVVPGDSETTPPSADYELTVSDLELDGVTPVSAGERTFAVHFGEAPEELGVQHLHLARLDEDTGADELAEWMKFDPVMPAPVEFLGGAEHMPAGETGYVTVDLDSGRYAWVLGVPPEQGEVETFTVE